MEELLWRFPLIGTKTFKRLSNQSLAKSKTVSRVWYNFITNEKFYKLRVRFENIQKDISEIRKEIKQNADDIQSMKTELLNLTRSFSRVYGKRL